MQRNANRPRAGFAQPLEARRARTLAVSLAFVLLGAALYAHNVQAAAACGSQADFLVGAKPLPSPVRPADCSRVFQPAPDFTWPAARGAATYTVVVTFPDGTRHERTTDHNWLAWDESLPAGSYTWQVIASGTKQATSQPRSFTVDATAAALAAPRADAPYDAAPTPTYPRDSHGISTLAATAPIASPMARETADRASSRASATAATAWTSPGVHVASRAH